MSVVKAPVGVSRRVGAHLSIAGGYEKGIERAIAIGADALQLFSGSPRVWQRPPMDKMAIARLTDASTTHDIRPLFVHALYLEKLFRSPKMFLSMRCNLIRPLGVLA
jgi:deoxyribonuclease-4